MKQWLKNNIWRIVASSAVTLLPMLFGIICWDSLPEIITTHWGANGVADGASGKAGAIFAPTAIMFGLNLLCIFMTAADKKNINQSQKAMGIIFWIVPVLSLFTNGVMYATAFQREIDVLMLLPGLLGVLFIILGNYMPKFRQNRTMGVKISWTLGNKENWNKTHRLAGKVWVAGGLAMIIAAFLPMTWNIGISATILAGMVIVPFAYSYSIYRKHKKQGMVYESAFKSKADRIALRITAIVVPLILVGVCVLMFTGDIRCEVTEDALKISATYYGDLTVELDEIDSVSYRETFSIGFRTYGYASARLSMGIFENAEFGQYTLYAYTGNRSVIVIESDGKVLIIGCKSSEQTRQLYETLQSRVQ